MKKNRKLWIVSAALVAVVLVAALCLLLPRLQVEPGVPKSGAIVRQEAAEDGRQLFVLERDMEHMSLQDIMDESDLVVMGFLLEQSPGFQVKSTDGEVSTFTNYFFQVTDTYRGEAPGDVITLREEGGTVDQVKTVVQDSCPFVEEQSYLLFLRRPQAGDTFATQGDYYTLTGGWQGVYPAGDTPVLRSVPMPLRNGHDEATLSTDELLAELEGMEAPQPAPGPEKYAKLLGEEPQFSGEPPLLDDPEQLNSLIHFRSYMGVDLAHLEKYSNLIVVADYLGRAGPQEGSAYTYRTFQVLDVLRGEAPEEGTVTLRDEGGYTSQEVTCVEPSHAFVKNDTYLLFLNQTAFQQTEDSRPEEYYLTSDIQGIYPLGDVLYTPELNIEVANVPMGLGPTFTLGALRQGLERINQEYPADVDYYAEEAVADLQADLDSGAITQEAYESQLEQWGLEPDATGSGEE